MSGVLGFLIAVGGVSAIILWLGTRGQNRHAARRSSNDSSGADTSYGSSDGWNIFSWFSSDNSSSDSSSSSSDSGGSDSGGGGDGGGGGGD